MIPTIPDLALSIHLHLGTASGSLVRHRSRIVAASTTSSETPLPEYIYPAELGQSSTKSLMPSLGQSSTKSLMPSRSISAELARIKAVLDAARLLGIDDEAESLVGKIVAENMPKPTTKRYLTRRSK
jgi:hypothetical protein